MKNNVKTFEELQKMNLTEIIEGKCYLKFDYTGSFSSANIHEQILELVKYFGLCDSFTTPSFRNSFTMTDAEHFGTNSTPKIYERHSKNNIKDRWGYVRNVSLFDVQEHVFRKCKIDSLYFYRDENNYYIIVGNLKTCSVFFYKDGDKLVVDDYPIYRILERANKRRVSEIKKEKNEKIKKFEMKLEMMGLQGFLEIDSLELREYDRTNLAKTAQLISRGYSISANYRKEWRENLFDLTHNNNKINLRQLTPEKLKIILTALQEIGEL